MICFVRRSTIDYDIRLKKYVQACEESKTPYIAVTWDRLLNSTPYSKHEYQYKREAPYGGGFNFLFLKWVFFVYGQLIKHFRSYKVIHACNLEVLMAVIPFKLFGKKIVFDIYDTVSPSIERRLMPFVNTLILPNIKRLKQEGLSEETIGKKLLIVENVPNFGEQEFSPKTNESFPAQIHLAYVGVLERKIRGLENLLDTVTHNTNLYLEIAGVGDDLEKVIEEAQVNCDRIKYHGKVDYHKALEIMNRADFIVAIYTPSFTPYVFASPNKFYESLYLAKPIISSTGTLVGTQIEDNNTGYLIEERDDALSDLMKKLVTTNSVEEYNEKSENCHRLWVKKYKDYFKTTLVGDYINQCKKLANG